MTAAAIIAAIIAAILGLVGVVFGVRHFTLKGERQRVAVERARVDRDVSTPLETDPEAIAAEEARIRRERD